MQVGDLIKKLEAFDLTATVYMPGAGPAVEVADVNPIWREDEDTQDAVIVAEE